MIWVPVFCEQSIQVKGEFKDDNGNDIANPAGLMLIYRIKMKNV